MTSSVGFSEIFLILAIMVIFIDSKRIPGLIRQSVKTIAQLRAAVKKFIDEINAKS